ncbi:hypothetical protein [Coprobacter sp.]
MSIIGKKIQEELSGDIPQMSLDELCQIQSDYPYFQTARFLYLKRLQKENPILYPLTLEKNAIYSGDRKSLFFLLEGSRQSWTSLYRHNTEKTENKSFSLIDSFLASQNEENLAENIEQLILQTGGAPTIDYLSVTQTAKNDKPDSKDLHNIDLIDSFIEKSEKGTSFIPETDISEKPESTTQMDKKPLTESTDDAFLTESLAKIYIKQRRYSKALEIIKKLSLKYPEKNIYFADQIRFLEKLITNIKTE